MKIASWNVNSLNVRLEQVLEWLVRHRPDVLGLQETKIPDERFPTGDFAELGYHVAFNGQPTYNGVALISRAAATDVVHDIPGYEHEHRRVIAGTVNGVRVVNLYVVNGKATGTEHYDFKLDWMAAASRWIEEEIAAHPALVVMGDFNVAPDDRDVHDPEAWREGILCSTPERKALGEILSQGLVDTFRLFEQPENSFSWWDYRQAAFRRGMGLRIDLILASGKLAERCLASYVDIEPRKNQRPSDHAPVVAEFDL